MKASTRPLFLRLLMLANEIRLSRASVPLSVLASHHLCSYRTIYRDLEFLRDIGCPIFFDAHINCWRWNRMIALPWWLGGVNVDVKPPPHIARGANYSSAFDPVTLGFARERGFDLDAAARKQESDQRKEANRLRLAHNTKVHRNRFVRRGLTCEGKSRRRMQHPELAGLATKNPKLYHKLVLRKIRAAAKNNR